MRFFMISAAIRDWTGKSLSPNLTSLLDQTGGTPSATLRGEVDVALAAIKESANALLRSPCTDDETFDVIVKEYGILAQCQQELCRVRAMIEDCVTTSSASPFSASASAAASSAAPAVPPAYSWANAPAAAASSAAPAAPAPIFRFPHMRSREESNSTDDQAPPAQIPRLADLKEHAIYVYIPLKFSETQSQALRGCVTPFVTDFKKGDQKGGIQHFSNPIGYHMTLGKFTVTGSQKAAEVAKKIQEAVRGEFSSFTAKPSARYSDTGNGIADLQGQEGRNYVTLTLQTDQQHRNTSHTVLMDLARRVDAVATGAGAQKVETISAGKKVSFQPHCTVSSYQPEKVAKKGNASFISGHIGALAAIVPSLFPIEVDPSQIGTSVS